MGPWTSSLPLEAVHGTTPGDAFLLVPHRNATFLPAPCDVEALQKLCTQSGAKLQANARTQCLLFRKFETAGVLPACCFISCYPICDSEPTKNSFLLRCPPHAESSWRNHISHYCKSILPALWSPAPGKKRKP